jgi:hypothetical protein
MGKVDQTLFLLRQGRDILIVQVYVDDIVFAGSSNSLVARFADDMSREFEMSMMGELQFFLGLQIKQSMEGTFVHQAKYTKDILQVILLFAFLWLSIACWSFFFFISFLFPFLSDYRMCVFSMHSSRGRLRTMCGLRTGG